MRHGSLFSGIGMADLAAQWMGWTNVFQVEKDEWCRRILERHFPNVARYGDIKEFDGTKYRGAIDIVSGGFPCQDISIANPNGAGLGGSRSGLWREMFRVIGEIEPRGVVGENVANLKQMGYRTIKTDLESLGYQVRFFDLPACAFGLPTMERHLWIVATSDRLRFKGSKSKKVQGVKGLPRELQRGYSGDFQRWQLPEARVCGVGQRDSGGLDRTAKAQRAWELVLAASHL